jgi:sigma-E factor negative regulatory protein RseC
MPGSTECFARVVATDGHLAWLEPEPAAGCGGCAAAAGCAGGALATRRFPLAGAAGLAVGERVVVGLADGAPVRASLVAYALPLSTMLAAGALAQVADGRDGPTLAGLAAGLAFGAWLARRLGACLAARGALAPRLLRQVAQSADAAPPKHGAS